MKVLGKFIQREVSEIISPTAFLTGVGTWVNFFKLIPATLIPVLLIGRWLWLTAIEGWVTGFFHILLFGFVFVIFAFCFWLLMVVLTLD